MLNIKYIRNKDWDTRLHCVISSLQTNQQYMNIRYGIQKMGGKKKEDNLGKDGQQVKFNQYMKQTIIYHSENDSKSLNDISKVNHCIE